MKILKFTFALILCATINACSSNDDDNTNLTEQKGSLVLKFDNAVGNQNFIFGTTYNKSNGESYTLETLKYIVSNVRIKTANGTTFTYPTEDNVFIIDESDGNNASEIWVTLDNVDASDYTEITFGIGIDQERFALGAEGQGDFLDKASEEGMFWTWASGYKFIRLDGTYSTSTVSNQPLNIHMGSVGTALDNYREVTLTLPNSVRVRADKTPQIHIKADISKIFDGTNPVNFSDGYDQVHTDQNETPIIATNISGMFEAHHVHNE